MRKDRICDENIELMVLALRPFYLPREISNLHVIEVYMPPNGDYKQAVATLREVVTNIENDFPDSVNIIMVDFNQCKIKKFLPNYQKYVQCAMLGDNSWICV
jgi:hypothetical protein